MKQKIKAKAKEMPAPSLRQEARTNIEEPISRIKVDWVEIEPKKYACKERCVTHCKLTTTKPPIYCMRHGGPVDIVVHGALRL